MSINNNYTYLTRVVTDIQNPNNSLGVLIEEIPSDIGRSYEGFKRGGVLEGAEKMRKELMNAAVWLGGIPLFKFLGDKFSEHILHLPMKVDFSNAAEGNDAIGDTLKYIFKGENPNNLDVSGISKKYVNKFSKYAKENINIEDMAKKVSNAKKITSVAAVVLNCLMMGIVLPKINQKITKNKLKEQKRKEYAPKFESMDEFQLKSKKNRDINFTGFFKDVENDIKKYGFGYTIGYRTENDSTFRLVSTDIPMIIGRVATSRNKYEALENLVMDGMAMYFYNFCSGEVQRGLRKLFGTKQAPIPDIMPTVSETILKIDSSVLKNAFATMENDNSLKTISEILPKDVVKEIYKAGTYQKYGQINKFVKNSDLENIDKSVFNFLNYIKSKQTESMPLIKDETVNLDLIKEVTSKVNKTNAVFLGAGLLASIIGLAVIVPKTTFWITKKLTGRNEFTGIANYDDDKKKKDLKA